MSFTVSKKENPVKISEDQFETDETRRESRKIEGRAVSLSATILAYIKSKRLRLVREMIKEIKSTGNIKQVRKANGTERERLIRLLSYYGIKQIDESGSDFLNESWNIPNEFLALYLKQKRAMIAGLDSRIDTEFQNSVNRALGKYLEEFPAPSVDEVSRRLRGLLEVESQKDAPKELKVFGEKFTETGMLARARMIARTEINAARNYGRVEAGKLVGRTHLIWLAMDDGRSGARHHEALNGQIREIGKPFRNPITGSQLLYPGDPGAVSRFRRGGRVVNSKFGAAGEIINCRCSVRPISSAVAERFRNRK